jgi:hypothetical protein
MKRRTVLSVWLALGIGVFAVPASPSRAASAGGRALPPAVASDRPASDQILISIRVYRLEGNISGETSLTDNVWEGTESETAGATKGPLTFFVLAKLTIGNIFSSVTLVANEKAWTWDGQDKPPKGGRVAELASPKIMVLPGQTYQMHLGAQVPVEYFEKQADGRFELKKLYELTGLVTSGTAELLPTGRIKLRDLTFQWRTIEKRDRMEGVSLDVGRPHIRTQTHQTTISVKPDCDYGIMFHFEGEGSMIYRLRASVVAAGKSLP